MTLIDDDRPLLSCSISRAVPERPRYALLAAMHFNEGVSAALHEILPQLDAPTRARIEETMNVKGL